MFQGDDKKKESNIFTVTINKTGVYKIEVEHLSGKPNIKQGL